MTDLEAVQLQAAIAHPSMPSVNVRNLADYLVGMVQLEEARLLDSPETQEAIRAFGAEVKP